MDSEVILELTSADIPGALDAIAKAGVDITQVVSAGDLTLRLRVRRQDVETVGSIAEKRGDALRQIRRLGLYWKLQSVARHWVLLLGLAGILILTAWLPTRVLFIQVEGNETVPTNLILERAADCGIVFGADRGAVRSERMKNALLDSLPQLQWAGINTSGCVAVITVEERQVPGQAEHSGPGNIVAVRDGIILEVTAVKGTAVTQPGKAVRAGEVLISGYTDCGGVILFQGAQGEAYARTKRQITALTTENRQVRGAETARTTKISLVIGKNRINFCEDSGILDTGCVKMYSEYYLTLPGGWTLPVKLVLETQTAYEMTEEALDPEEAERLLSEQAAAYLQSRMIAGQILSAKEYAQGCCYSADYVCREMIGRLVHEEIVQEYGENRRENG